MLTWRLSHHAIVFEALMLGRLAFVVRGSSDRMFESSALREAGVLQPPSTGQR